MLLIGLHYQFTQRAAAVPVDLCTKTQQTLYSTVSSKHNDSQFSVLHLCGERYEIRTFLEDRNGILEMNLTKTYNFFKCQDKNVNDIPKV